MRKPWERCRRTERRIWWKRSCWSRTAVVLLPWWTDSRQPCPFCPWLSEGWRQKALEKTERTRAHQRREDVGKCVRREKKDNFESTKRRPGAPTCTDSNTVTVMFTYHRSGHDQPCTTCSLLCSVTARAVRNLPPANSTTKDTIFIFSLTRNTGWLGIFRSDFPWSFQRSSFYRAQVGGSKDLVHSWN